MKTQSDFLFRFIKSLTPSEKRYFKLYASRHVVGEKNKYLKLFEALERQSDYNEKLIKTTLGEKSIIRHFSATKTRLKEMILDALDDYERNNAPQEQLKKQLHQVKLLALKGFKKEAARLLEKVQKRAVLSDSLEIALLATKTKIPLMGLPAIDLEAYRKEEQHYTHLLQHQSEFNYLHYKTYQLIYKWNRFRSQEDLEILQEVIQHPLLQHEKKALTFRAKMQFYDIHATYHSKVTRDSLKTYNYQKAYLQFLEKDEDRMRMTPSVYYTGFFNYLQLCKQLEKYSEMIEGLELLKVAAKKFGYFKTSHFQQDYLSQRYFLLMGMYHSKQETKEALALIPELIQYLDNFTTRLKGRHKIHFFYQISYVYFLSGHLDDALEWIHKTLDYKGEAINQQLNSIARLLQVLIHYEWKNENLVISLVRGHKRYLRKQNTPFKTELTLLKYLNRLAKAVDKKSKFPLLQKLKAELNVLKEDAFEQPVFGYFPFLEWVEAQIAGKKLRKILKQKLTSDSTKISKP